LADQIKRHKPHPGIQKNTQCIACLNHSGPDATLFHSNAAKDDFVLKNILLSCLHSARRPL
jgi:hypothetical protein